MARYIDADVLRDLIDGGYDIDFDEVPETKAALLEMIDNQETADVVEVVRCKDCKYGHPMTYVKGLFYRTCAYPFGHGLLVTEHGFCAWGERRENG